MKRHGISRNRPKEPIAIMAESLPLLTRLARAPDRLDHPPLNGEANAAGHTGAPLPGKCQAPRLPGSLVERPHLLQRVVAQPGARLVLLRAPAGFGKSTLLAQLHARSEHGAWLSLDGGDNDPGRLSRALTLTLANLLDSVASAPMAEDILERAPEYLLDALGASDKGFSLFLDEFEALQAPDALERLRSLWERFPPNGRLFIASRSTPALRFGALRARGELLELNADALRFDLGETRVFLQHRLGPSLPESAIETLQSRTEGWVTALHLAALSLQDRRDPGAFVATFCGSHLELAEYLTDDILAQLPEELRAFLLRTSLLERFCAPLCNALTEREDAQAMLAEVQRLGLFLVAQDGHGEWFRYHRLFSGFLRHALGRQRDIEVEPLHRTAAHWYLRHGHPLSAIEHLLKVEDAGAAMTQLEHHLEALLDSGRYHALLRCLDQLPAALVDQHPRLAVVHAWMLLLARRYQQALQVVERNPDAPESETIRCLLLAFSDQIEATCSNGLRHFASLSAADTLQRGLLGSTLAYCLVASGQVAEARRVLAQLAQTDGGCGLIVVESVADGIESVIDIIQGQLATARVRLDVAAHRRLQSTEQQWLAGRISVDVMRALVLYESDQLEEAQQVLSQSPGLAALSAGPDALISSRILLARIGYCKGDRNTWVHHLASLEQLGRQGGPCRLICAAWLERARVATLEGHLEQAAQALRSAEFNNAWDQPGLLLYSTDVDTLFIARQRWHIAHGDARVILDNLCAAIVLATQQQHHRRALKLRLLLALALAALARQEEAFDTLTAALQWASREGFLRTFLEEGPPLAQLLQAWAARRGPSCSSQGIDPDFLQDLLRRSGALAGVPAEAALLSPRELDVLRLLAGGQRNQSIAERLSLSLHTVKTHLRNISSKLGAEGRTDVIAIARARRLID